MKKNLFVWLLCGLLLLTCLPVSSECVLAEETKADPEEEEKVVWDGTEAEFHIGVVTGTVSQAEDDLRGAEALIERYGDSAEGGMITHIAYPDNFSSEQETTISQIVGLADDPLMKAIVVNQAVPGTAAAFDQIREIRDDILLFAAAPHEDPNMIAPAADLVLHKDNVNRGYLVPLAAQKLGAKNFVHVSFPRHMSYQMLSLRRAIFKVACEQIGLNFYDETAPDPQSEVGAPGAQAFILEHMDDWVKKYGEDTCFFATNDAHTEPMLKKIAELGAIFVEADSPSPLMGYPAAFDIQLKDVAGDWPAILKRVEETVVEKGGEGRMGTWAVSFGYSASAGLGEFAKGIIEGKYERDEEGNFKIEDITESLGVYSYGAHWMGNYYFDTSLEEPATVDNYLLVIQDTYILGKGFLGLTDEEIPELYRNLTANDGDNEKIVEEYLAKEAK